MKGLPDDNGLFMPSEIPVLPASFFQNLKKYNFSEIAYEVCKTLIGEVIPESKLKEIVEHAVNFPAPVVSLDEQTHVLELFHGPSLAFKDFGARFMAQLMGHFNEGEDKELTILVATSGDTGGAVAAGFYKTPGIRVVILYPSGKVSALQEKQLTTLGHNITALEVDGTFDDCQALVKQAFLDKDLTTRQRLSSANSINIARLIPQSFYYIESYKQLKTKENAGRAHVEKIHEFSLRAPLVFSIPSGNFGNLTAGLLVKKMGLPVHSFIAATNTNDVVPQYLATGEYKPRPSTRTLSNAMDVGNPSNFARMLDLDSSTWNIMKEDIKGYAYTDAETCVGVREVFDKYKYIIDPHGAVGYLAFRAFQKANPDVQGVILETAHPSKFLDTVEETIEQKVEIPERLAILADKKKKAIQIGIDFAGFKSWLMGF